MDNITHTAVGALATEFIYQRICPQKDKPKLRTSLHITSAFANNLPDFDLLMQLIVPGKLGYLINHRGHTHTFVGLLTELLFALGVVALALKIFSKKPLKNHNLKVFGLVAATGLFLHVGMDSMNSYGVHPFWPFDNSWYYGDFVFIIEPYLWIATAVSLFHIAAKKIFLWPYLLLALFSPLIAWNAGMSTWLNSAMVTILGLGFFFYSSIIKPNKLPRFGLLTCFSIVCMFGLQSFYAKEYLAKNLTLEGFEHVDSVTSPYPGNFFCWSFLKSFKNQNELRTYAGLYSTFENLKFLCPEKKLPGGSVAFGRIEKSERVSLKKVYSQKIRPLQDLYESNCSAQLWFTYARSPYLFEEHLHDLRFARGSLQSFASLDLSSQGSCPDLSSPWTPPRINLLKNSK